MNHYQKGPHNGITDVAGIRVAHITRVAPSGKGGSVRTGATVIVHRDLDALTMRPAAAVTMGGTTEFTGLCALDDFGFLLAPVIATNLRAVGTAYNAIMSLTGMFLTPGTPTFGLPTEAGWPPTVVGFDDRRLNDLRTLSLSEEEFARVLSEASDGPAPEGAVGAGTGLVAFGFKSGVGSASRALTVGGATYTVGALALLNLGQREALTVGGVAVGRRLGPAKGASPMQGSALLVLATDAPLDARGCRRLALAALDGLARLGAVPGPGEGVAALALSTGVLLRRLDQSAKDIPFPLVDEATLGALTGPAAEAAEDAALRTLTTVAREDGTPEYPILTTARLRQLIQSAGSKRAAGRRGSRHASGK